MGWLFYLYHLENSVNLNKDKSSIREEKENFNMIVTKINTVFIPVADLRNSVEWYSENLGFRLDPEQYREIDHLPVYTFPMGETSLTLEAEESFMPSTSTVPICNFHTAEIGKVREDFLSRGISIESDIITFPDFSYFNFRDLNGNLLMICTG
jgi:predicted enzyme related to lactoylglutathione lyase